MDSVRLGLLLSACCVCLLLFLFRRERIRGVRYAANVRAELDTAVVVYRHKIHTAVTFIFRDGIRQTFHYLFHLLLALMLKIVRVSEAWLRKVMRTNKTLARSAERTTKNKLDEVAEHKASIALTDEEKRKARKKLLQ